MPPTEAETLPWEQQLAADDASYRTQLAYLLERSAFYREKLAGVDTDGGLAGIAGLPLTEKDELRQTRTRENPVGTHLCAAADEIVRIYSTSGTTGTPSYIPLTAGDLDNWITGSARSYAASGIASGQRIVSTYNAGPFVAGAALATFDRLGLCHIPVGTGNTERLVRAIELLRPEAAVLTPSYAAYLAENHDLRDSSVERVLVAGEPGGGEPAFRARLEEAWGAKVTEAMGIGDIGVSLWGECEEQDGMHLGARGFVHAELIDPDTGAALEPENGVTGELVLTHLRAPRRAAAPLSHARSRRGEDELVPVRQDRPAGSLHRPHRRHADRPRRQRLPGRDPRGRERVRAGRERADPRPAEGCRGEAGATASSERRARSRNPPRRRARGGDPRPASRGARRPDGGGAGRAGQPAAKRVQVDARQARALSRILTTAELAL